MRTLLAGVVAAVVAVAASDVVQENAGKPAALSAAAKVTAEDLLFMSGSWQAGGGKEAAKEHRELVEEHWTLPADGSLIGMSRTRDVGQTVFFEFLRIEQTVDGVDYVAQPKGGPPVRFKCTALAGRKAVFENPQHDFPTRITYERISDDELLARVEGPASAKEKPQEFRFTKAGEGVRLPD